MGMIFVFAVLPFMLVVLPLWLFFSFLGKLRAGSQLTSAQESELRELYEVAQRAEKRLQTLEAILDKQSPQWRDPS